MARCLNLTRGGEYAVSALTRLALESGGLTAHALPLGVLARLQEIPESFLSKIVARCSKAGLVRTSKGPRGGIALRRPAAEITLLSIIEACEGALSRESCVFFVARSCPGTACEVYCALRKSEEEVRLSLGRVTLAEMAASLERHPDFKSKSQAEAENGTRGRN